MSSSTRPARRRTPRSGHRWRDLDHDALLRVKFCDLRLGVTDSVVAADIDSLYRDLERRGITFKPHVWLSTDWFSPDGVPGIAIPFYAADPQLCRLQQKMTGEAEGATQRWRRRILRHEAGHAIDTAFGLRRRADWRRKFGPASKPYRHSYWARPCSRRYVQHLGHWYAQSHPTEDFAETFAVWLQPKARWRRDYAAWPAALAKLEFVDALMQEVAGAKPRNRDRSIIAPLSANARTLGEHYRRRSDYEDPSGQRYDRWLREALVPFTDSCHAVPADRFIRVARRELRRRLAKRTAGGAYLIDYALTTVARRTRALQLKLGGRRRDKVATLTDLVERIVADVLRRNREKYVL